MFPLAFDPGTARLQHGIALSGGMLQAISHATAKAAMFMAAGLIYAALGHDRIAGLAGIARVLPMSVLAFVLGGVALMGVLPSGAYLAKKLLLEAAAGTGQWWWAVVMQAGGLFTTGYVVLVLAHSLSPAAEPVRLRAPVPRAREAAALALAVCSLLLALAAFGPVPRDTLTNPLAPKELWSAVVLVLGGVMLAIALGRRLPHVRTGEGAVTIVRPVRRALGAVCGMVERADGVLRQWPIAGVSLLLLAMLFGAAMMTGR
jgi:formate hydrogenlyase subunit 3/multisubunit Na+/H+ antiporter MnhD subunit